MSVILPTDIILAFVLFIIKHFFADFFFQDGWMAANKGNVKHPAGYLHALTHAVWTVIALAPFGMELGIGVVLLAALADGVIHYVIDWAKVNVNDHLGLKPSPELGCTPNEARKFWILMGFDQFLHMITYVLIIIVLFV